jgi:FtsZ-interacting cell division protein ZipA
VIAYVIVIVIIITIIIIIIKNMLMSVKSNSFTKSNHKHAFADNKQTSNKSGLSLTRASRLFYNSNLRSNNVW